MCKLLCAWGFLIVSRFGFVLEVQPSPPEPEKEQIPVVRLVEAGQDIIQIEVVGQVQQVWNVQN